jgi:CDP-2,3-bis-(O-geranylgeranyl)-sn-glycerol synthase
MTSWIFDILLLYLPAFIANATPLLIIKLPWVKKHNAPVWTAKLGAHKTWMGLGGGVVAGALCGGLLHAFLPESNPAEPFYDDLPFALFFGALLGLGALLGDAAKSMLKRKLGIAPGGWLPILDAIDYTVGALIVALPFHVPMWTEALILLALGWLLSTLSNLFSYWVGLKRVWY